MTSKPTIQFFGGAETVTGSKHLIRAGDAAVLLDCGLFQGHKPLRFRNWAPPPFSPRELTAVVLSHAHLDHSGYLPALARAGYRGPVHCTDGTKSVVEILLRDSAKLHMEEAAYANRHGTSQHSPALPLYDFEDAERAIQLLRPWRYAKPFSVGHGVEVTFRKSGHILGSATVEVALADGLRVLFSGDLGRRDQPILCDPDPPPRVNVLVVESTYGDRVHAPNPKEELARVVRGAAARGGALLIPAFAVGRTQTLLWLLRELENEKKIPAVPLFLDSPMAHQVSQVTCRHEADLDEDMLVVMERQSCPICNRTYQFCETAGESKALNHKTGPLIVIAGSGMATGGRILHHLRQRLPDPKTTVLLVGYQAGGTRGRSLQEGQKQVKMLGDWVDVRAHIETLDGLSAHADREETLQWLSLMPSPPQRTYVVHGELAAAKALARAIEERLRWNVAVARDQQRASLGVPE